MTEVPEPEVGFEESLGDAWQTFLLMEEALKNTRARIEDSSQPLDSLARAEAKGDEARIFDDYEIACNTLALAYAGNEAFDLATQTVWATALQNTELIIEDLPAFVEERLALLGQIEAKLKGGEPILFMLGDNRFTIYTLLKSELVTDMKVVKDDYGNSAIKGGDIFTTPGEGGTAVILGDEESFPHIAFEDAKLRGGLMISPADSYTNDSLKKILAPGEPMEWHEYNIGDQELPGIGPTRICVGEEDIKRFMDDVNAQLAFSILLLARSEGYLMDTQSPLSNEETEKLRQELASAIYLGLSGFRPHTKLPHSVEVTYNNESKRERHRISNWDEEELKALADLVGLNEHQLRIEVMTVGLSFPTGRNEEIEIGQRIDRFIHDMYSGQG